MAAQIPQIQAHSTVEVEDSCNDCSPCCWGRRAKKIKKDNDKFIKELEMPVRDSHDVYNFTVNVQESPEIHTVEKPPLKRDPTSVRDLTEIIKGIQDKK